MAMTQFMRDLLTSLGVGAVPATLLAIPPTSSGFATVDGDSTVSIQLDGGGPRVRKDQLNVVTRVSAAFVMTPEDYTYFRAFYRTSMKNGSQPFTIPLLGIDDSNWALYSAQMVGGTLKWPSNQGATLTVTMDMWVMPNNVTTGDAAIISAFIS